MQSLRSSGSPNTYRCVLEGGRDGPVVELQRDKVRFYNFTTQKSLFIDKPSSLAIKFKRQSKGKITPDRTKQWENLEFDGSKCPALKKKGLKNLLGFSVEGTALFPFRKQLDSPGVVGWQYRSIKSNGTKTLKGCSLKNRICVIQRNKRHSLVGSEVVLVTESVTTGLEVAEAIPDCTVVAVAGMTNLLAACKSLRGKVVVVCGDSTHSESSQASIDDHNKIYSAIRSDGFKIIWPVDIYSKNDLRITDFNDYAFHHGKTAVKRKLASQLRVILPIAPTVSGFDKDRIRLYSHITNTVFAYSPLDLCKEPIQVASTAWWEHIRRILATDESGIDFGNSVFEFLSQGAKSNRNNHIYGIGIFKDGDDFVLNCQYGTYVSTKKKIEYSTKSVLKDGRILAQIERNDGVEDLSEVSPLNIQEFKNYLKTLNRLYDMPVFDLELFMGFLVHACFPAIGVAESAGLWLTGQSHVGKSTLAFRVVANRLLKGFCFSSDKQTEAGIRMQLTDENDVVNSHLVVCDETSKSKEANHKRLNDLFELFKSIAASENPTFVCGTAALKGKVFKLKASMMFVGVSKPEFGIEHDSRCLHLKLKNTVDRKSQKMFDVLYKASDIMRPKWLVTMLKVAPIYIEMFPYIRDKIKEITSTCGFRNSAHFPATLSLCLSAYFALLKFLKPNIDVDKLFEKRRDDLIARINDFESMSNTNKKLVIDLLSCRIQLNDYRGSLAEALKIEGLAEEIKKFYGIKYKDGTLFVAVSKDNFSLKRLSGIASKADERVFVDLRNELHTFSELRSDDCEKKTLRLRGQPEYVLKIQLKGFERTLVE